MPGPSPGGRHASGGSEPSAVPQPSSAGCAPSPRKPSTDQVETNSPAALGVRLTWLSCSEIWMVRIPSSPKQACPASGGRGSLPRQFDCTRKLERRGLEELRHEPRVGSLADHRRGAAVAQLFAQGQRPGAERLVGALRRRQIRVGVAAWPGLNSRVQVECAAGGGEPQQLEAGHVHGEVEEEVAGPQMRLEHRGEPVARQRRHLEADTMRRGHLVTSTIGREYGQVLPDRVRTGATGVAARSGQRCRSRPRGRDRQILAVRIRCAPELLRFPARTRLSAAPAILSISIKKSEAFSTIRLEAEVARRPTPSRASPRAVRARREAASPRRPDRPPPPDGSRSAPAARRRGRCAGRPCATRRSPSRNGST